MALIATLLSPLLGAAVSVVPDIVGLFRFKAEAKFEIEKLEAQAKYATALHELKIDELNVKADISEIDNLYAHDRSISGGRFMDFIRASVRPVITYCFFALFVWTELTITAYLIDNGATALDVAQYIWDDEVMSLFGAVMGFWFGGRQIEKYRKRYQNGTTNRVQRARQVAGEISNDEND